MTRSSPFSPFTLYYRFRSWTFSLAPAVALYHLATLLTRPKRLELSFFNELFCTNCRYCKISNTSKAIKMEKSKEKEILKMFPTNRLWDADLTLTILYAPIGILLTCLRICLTLNFLIADQLLRFILPENSSVFRTINWIFLLILGIKVEIIGESKICAGVIVSNQRSNIDGFILSHALNIYSEDRWKFSSIFCNFLRVTPFDITTTAGKMLPIVVFPEGCANSGRGIMKFQQKYFTDTNMVQIVGLEATRSISISISTAGSGIWQDAISMLYTPLTIYKIKLMEYPIKKDNKSIDEFSHEVANEMSKILGVPLVQITAKDKTEYFKKVKQRKTFKTSPRLLNMAKKVQEIVPHVPQNVILQDLVKTNSVDVTLANIFEGVVKFNPVRQPAEKSSVAKSKRKESSKKPLTEMEKRKAEFMKNARKRYLETHGPDALS